MTDTQPVDLEKELFDNEHFKKLLEQVAPEERAAVEASIKQLIMDFRQSILQPLEELLNK